MDKFDKLNLKITSVSIDVKELSKKVDGLDKKLDRKFDKVMTHLDGLAKGFKKFGEESTILSAHSRDHTDRIEKLENAVFRTS